MFKSNELIKSDFNIDRDGIPLRKQNKLFNESINERASKFDGIKDKINPNKLIYKFKTVGKIPKVFRDYQMLLELFGNLRDDGVHPKEVFKNKIKI